MRIPMLEEKNVIIVMRRATGPVNVPRRRRIFIPGLRKLN